MEKEHFNAAQYLLDKISHNPESVFQIDAATGQEVTNKTLLKRTYSLASSLCAFGLKPNEVIAITGMNHVDIHVPFFAGQLIGCPVAGLDPSYKIFQFKNALKTLQPKICFCDSHQEEDIKNAIKELALNTSVVSFSDDGLDKFMKEHCRGDDNSLPSFDGSKTFCWLVSTSGSTGIPKFAAITHENIMRLIKIMESDTYISKYGKNNCFLLLSPVQWLSFFLSSYYHPIASTVILQISADVTTDHVVDVITRYKPGTITTGPPLLREILQHPNCDLTCFKGIIIAGSKCDKGLIESAQSKASNAKVQLMYRQTEVVVPVLLPVIGSPVDSIGQLTKFAKAKLVDTETKLEVTEPYRHGELWIQKPFFTEYYNSPQETKAAFSPDGWFMSGDILMKDENGYFYFIDRVKTLIKYKLRLIAPSEIEDVIRSNCDVMDVVVTSIYDGSDDLPVACVIKNNKNVTEHDIRSVVEEQLSEFMQLRGGVFFMDKFPVTSTGKVNINAIIKELKEIIKETMK